MAAAQKTKASDRQSICKKLVPLLKKRYKQPVPKQDRAILETMLYAVCLENASTAQADEMLARLEASFHDLNEVRVSSISELIAVLDDAGEPELRAMRVRSVLRYVFEKNYQFEFENLRRKTLEQAVKQLQRITDLSPFARRYTLQAALGSHIIPLDDSMRRAAVWLGLVDPEMSIEEASDTLKAAIRKADAPAFCHLLRCLATDPAVSGAFDAKYLAEDGYDMDTAPTRLADLFKKGFKPPKKKASRKSATAKKAGTTKKKAKPAARNSSKTTARKTSAKSKSAAKKKVKKKK